MKTGPQPTPKFNPLKPGVILPFIVLIIVMVLAAWFAHDNRKNGANGSIPAGWTWFNSQKYGFKFAYPPSWGTPSVGVTSGKVGSFYEVSFKTNPTLSTADKNLTVLVDIYSQDYVSELCAQASCPAQTTLNSQTIQKNIKNGAAVFMKHDSSSYASLNNAAGSNTSSLTDVQIVNIPKINATGAIGTYSLSSANNCPAGAFAAESKTSCIRLSDYNSLNSALKSIASL